VVILPDAPPIINIGTYVSLCGNMRPLLQSLLGNTVPLFPRP